jgi:hypothetical protein
MSKKIPECMDRELPGKTALFAKATAGNTTFVKNFLLIRTMHSFFRQLLLHYIFASKAII